MLISGLRCMSSVKSKSVILYQKNGVLQMLTDRNEQTLSLDMRGQTTGARSTTHVSHRYREFHNLVPQHRCDLYSLVQALPNLKIIYLNIKNVS